MEISLMIEGQMGLNWPRWKSIVRAVEDLGFHGLFRSDHFTSPQPPDQDSLELIVSLVHVAENTERIHFGQLVSPVSFRNPVFLARQAAAIADLSGGRHILGVGMGWQDREHQTFGFDLGSIKARADRLEEALQIISPLLKTDEPVTFSGKHFKVNGAHISPKPPTPPPILLGGNGPKRSLPLAARYADWWNGGAPNPEGARERNQLLDDLMRSEGRDPKELKRTLMAPVFFGKDEQEAYDRLGPMRGHPAVRDKKPIEALEFLRANGSIAGTPEIINRQLDDLEAAGIQEVMLQWFALDDLRAMESFASACVRR